MQTAGILGWKRSKYQRPILHSSKTPETSRKSFLELIKILSEEITRGGPHPGHEGGGAPYPLGAPLPRGPPGRPPVPIFYYMKSFTLENIISKLSGRNTAATRRNRSRAPVELFCRGNIPLGGGNRHHHHHHRSYHQEGGNLHQHHHQHHFLSNSSSSLVSDLCLKTSDWYLWVSSSVDYSLQLMLVGLFDGRLYFQILNDN